MEISSNLITISHSFNLTILLSHLKYFDGKIVSILSCILPNPLSIQVFLYYCKDAINNKNNVLLREEKTKVTEMFIRNPYNKYRPSRIIAINIREGILKQIVFEIIHLSCILAFNRLSTITSQLIFS